MASKKKITLTNSLSSDELNVFDEMIDESLDENIGNENICDNGENDYSHPLDNENYVINDEKVDIFNRKDKLCPFSDKNMNLYDDINDKMVEIYNEFVDDTRITIANISGMSMNEAYIKGRWASKLMAAKSYHKRLKAEYKELKSKITEMVSEKTKNTAFLKQKMSVDSIVNNDVNIKELWKKIEEAAMLEELYAYYYDIIKGLGYQIRNSIDTLNFERGM